MHQHKFIFTFFVTLFLLLFPINSSQSDHCPNNTTSNSGPYIVGSPPWPDWCILRGPHFPYEICIVPFGPFGQPRFITGTERQETVQYNGLHSISTEYNGGSVGWRKPVLSLFPSICPPGSSVILLLLFLLTNAFHNLYKYNKNLRQIYLSTREQCNTQAHCSHFWSSTLYCTNTFWNLHKYIWKIAYIFVHQRNTQAHTVPRYFHFCSFFDRPSGKYILTFRQIILENCNYISKFRQMHFTI